MNTFIFMNIFIYYDIYTYIYIYMIYIYIYIYIYRPHFFVNADFIKHNRHFMSTYFLLDPNNTIFMPNNTTTENSHRQHNIRTSK